MTVRLMAAEEELGRERREHGRTREQLSAAATQLDQLALLEAQLEVYQADFNAEREARERIAGEKADLEEQLRKVAARAASPRRPTDLAPVQAGAGAGAGLHKAPASAPPPPLGRRDSQGTGRAMFLTNGARERLHTATAHAHHQDQQFDNIPATVNTRCVLGLHTVVPSNP